MNSDSPRPKGDNHGVSVEGTRDILERQGLRWTRQREAVYEALASTKSHPTAEELFRIRLYDPRREFLTSAR